MDITAIKALQIARMYYSFIEKQYCIHAIDVNGVTEARRLVAACAPPEVLLIFTDVTLF
jgi:hypothetical protein